MVNENILFVAIEKNELVDLLRGEEPYKIENSQYSPGGETTDVGKVLAKIIYKAYKLQPNIKKEIELALLEMLHQTDFDVYIVVLYVVSQLFKEKYDLSPFKLDMTKILVDIKLEVKKRKAEFVKGVAYPSGFVNSNAWNDIKRFNLVCQEEYGIKLL